MKAITITVIFLALYAKPASGKCKPDEVEICADEDWQQCFCKMCISCPAGYGPSHQCSGRYVNGTIIRCRPCISGVSYSEEYSIASCQPCQQCGGKKTLQKCTPKRESSCSTKCRVGYIMSHAVDQCLPDPSFVTTSRQTNTVKLTTHLPIKTTTIHPSTIPNQVIKTQRESQGTTKPVTHPDTSGSNSARKDSNHSRDNKIIILSVIGIAVVVFVGYCVLKKKQVACFHRDNARNQDYELKAILNDQNSTSPRSSQEIVLWPDNHRLKDIKLALRSDITNHISENSTVVKGWRAIGEERKLSANDLQAIRVEGQKQGTTQGEQLLMVLACCQPELTLTEFVNTLEILGRKDVVDLIKDHYNNENRINSAIQIITQDSQNDQPDCV